METKFKIIIDTEQGRVVHPAADLAEAITLYREKLDEYPDRQIHLVRNMPMQFADPASQPTAKKVEKHKQIDRRYLQQVTDGADPSNPLYGKTVVMSGTYEQIGMEREQVADAIQRLGAKLNRSVSRTMNVFITGNKPGPSKLAEVEQLRAEGNNIRILSQLELKEIISQYL